jgi:membrane fusion protein, multidrug efflux system
VGGMVRNMALTLGAIAAALGIMIWVLGSAKREPVPGSAPSQITGQITGAEKANGAKKAGLPQRGKGPERAVAVEVATARGASITTDIRAVGGLQSDESVQITSEIAGRVAEFEFSEGGSVKAGDILVKLDEALAKAELADAQARYDLASANNDRAKQLSRSGNVTEKAIDEATANFQIARAALEQAASEFEGFLQARSSRSARRS